MWCKTIKSPQVKRGEGNTTSTKQTSGTGQACSTPAKKDNSRLHRSLRKTPPLCAHLAQQAKTQIDPPKVQRQALNRRRNATKTSTYPKKPHPLEHSTRGALAFAVESLDWFSAMAAPREGRWN